MYLSEHKVGLEYLGPLNDSTNTINEFECEAYCLDLGPPQERSIAWKFFTDDTSGTNCQCIWAFLSLGSNQQSNANAISGKFVPDGNPTVDNCRDRCYFLQGDVYWGTVTSSEECANNCKDGSYAGYSYHVLYGRCYCLTKSHRNPRWDAAYDTVVFAD